MSFAQKSFIAIFVLLVTTGAGCESASRNFGTPSETASEDIISSTSGAFNAADLISEEATVLQVYSLDLDADDVMEYAVEYSLDDTIGQHGQPVQKAYLEVFIWDDQLNAWTSIKKDEIDTRLRQFEISVLHFDASPRDYLLVSKPSLPHGYTDNYYVFGDANNNGEVFGDLSIPKAYLHEEDYLNEGDIQLYFRGVSPSANALIEYYEVSCESKEYTEPRFGDAPGDAFGPCRRLEVSHAVTQHGFTSEAALTKNVVAE